MAQEMVSDKDLPIRLQFCKATSFALTSYGKILLIISYIIQGPVVLLLIIITNVWSIISFRNFLKRKLNMTIKSNVETNQETIKKQKKIEKRDRNLLKMTVFLTLFSFVLLLIQFTCQLITFVFINLLSNQIAGLIIFMYLLAMTLKQFTNIFFYFLFNRSFRLIFISIIKRE